jgi:uncharacterized protein (TIGR02996 family)
MMVADERAFLLEIAHHPADRTVRFVYADWLEEHDDPRGELIRVEEEMRGLSVFSDRFWELKPRRNELRTTAGADWLARMRYGTECDPMFRHGVPDGWKERWRLIREFTERWHGIPMPDVGGRRDEVAEAEQRLGRALPPSLQEWIAFAHDSRRDVNYHDVICDIYLMVEYPGHPAIPLLMPPDGDYHWSIQHEDLGHPDPPVCIYVWEYPDGFDAPPIYVRDEVGPPADTLTEFVLGYAMRYASGRGGGLSVQVDEPDRLLAALRTTFPLSTRFGALDIYEADNFLVLTSPSDRGIGVHLRAQVFKPIPREQVPAFLWGLCRRGCAGHGMFLPPNMVEDVAF